jgi:hypothetical protein
MVLLQIAIFALQDFVPRVLGVTGQAQFFQELGSYERRQVSTSHRGGTCQWFFKLPTILQVLLVEL